jgi:hypothetical protein
MSGNSGIPHIIFLRACCLRCLRGEWYRRSAPNDCDQYGGGYASSEAEGHELEAVGIVGPSGKTGRIEHRELDTHKGRIRIIRLVPGGLHAKTLFERRDSCFQPVDLIVFYSALLADLSSLADYVRILELCSQSLHGLLGL